MSRADKNRFGIKKTILLIHDAFEMNVGQLWGDIQLTGGNQGVKHREERKGRDASAGTINWLVPTPSQTRWDLQRRVCTTGRAEAQVLNFKEWNTRSLWRRERRRPRCKENQHKATGTSTSITKEQEERSVLKLGVSLPREPRHTFRPSLLDPNTQLCFPG